MHDTSRQTNFAVDVDSCAASPPVKSQVFWRKNVGLPNVEADVLHV